ncbi:MAG: hypothetical protein JXR60_07885 [Bacteroidales bacterium]|nr:hypothetical protein [Bacteroidales bacterium]
MNWNKYSYKSKLYFATMIFAFLWVIIGDLVAMHIHVIYGKDLYDCHQPYSKSHKTSDHKDFQIKTQKAEKAFKSLKIHALLPNQFSANFQKISYKVFNDCAQSFVFQHNIPNPDLRGPPYLI